MLKVVEFQVEQYLQEQQMVLVQQYKYFGFWSEPKLMSVEKARRKLHVRVDGWCPYRIVKVC